MNISVRYLIAWMGISVLLSPGCSAGRQSRLHRETSSETQTVRMDSLVLREMLQSSRKRTIDIEHIVFDTCRSSIVNPDTSCIPSCTASALLPHTVTRITINERDQAEVSTSLRSDSKTSSHQLSSNSFQKEHAAGISPGKWLFMFLIGGVLLCIFIYIFFNIL